MYETADHHDFPVFNYAYNMQLLDDGQKKHVLNEREVRAAAGLLFVPMLVGWMLILLNDDFLLIKFYIIVLHADLLIRVFAGPAYSPSIILGRLIVSRQTPEYVAEAPKKFAWKIGIMLSGVMLLLVVILNTYSIFTWFSCLVCLAFLFFESAFGLCPGCLVYEWFYKRKLNNCPGNSCEKKEKHPLQKIRAQQLIVLLIFIVFAMLLVIFFKAGFGEQPKSLWKL